MKTAEPTFTHEKLPSGKVIMRRFGDDGSLLEEHQTHGLLDIGIQFCFQAGNKTSESYFVKRRVVGRRAYEKARPAYPDMPESNAALSAEWEELLRAARKENRQQVLDVSRRPPNPKELDAFCETLMGSDPVDAVQWVQFRNHTLGERTWLMTKRLVQKFIALGCVHVYACNLDCYEDGSENTGHLVVELPKNESDRKNVFKMIHRLAKEQGYVGPFDEGQRFAYLKLD